MNKRNVPQSVKTQIRNEVKRELENAIRMGVEKGSVVTSNGDMLTFTVLYREQLAPRISISLGGITSVYIADLVSAALYEWGYTRNGRVSGGIRY